jgi:phytoene dehydrogenase-like protein
MITKKSRNRHVVQPSFNGVEVAVSDSCRLGAAQCETKGMNMGSITDTDQPVALASPISTPSSGQPAGVVIIGGGHNGLICGTYLAKAGLSVTIIEARSSLGGNAATETALDGARFNICNCDHTMIRSTPIAEELSLASFGLKYVDSHLSQVNVHWDGGPAWFLFHDLERTIDGLKQTYPAEAENYRRYVKAAMPIVKTVLDVANATPTPGSISTKVAKRPLGAVNILRWSNKSVGDVMRSFFQAEQLRGAAITTGPVVWGLSPEFGGTGLGAMTYALRHAVLSGRPVGGSGALPDALEAAFVAAGGTVMCNTRVGKIICEGDQVVGVHTTTGEAIDASIVVCAADPRAALVDWLTGAPPQAQALMQRYQQQPQHDGYESKVDAVLNGRYQFKAVTDDLLQRHGLTAADASHATSIVSVSLADMHQAFLLKDKGQIAERPMFFANTPSVKDPSVAAGLKPGQDIFSLETLWTPYALEGGWEGSTQPQRWLDRFGDLVDVPGYGSFSESVDRWRLMGPMEYEKQFAMVRGYAPSFAGTPITTLLGKDPELTRYETPVKGLFLTGAATFPGAGIWGAAGRNAAAAILRSDSRLAGARRAARNG